MSVQFAIIVCFLSIKNHRRSLPSPLSDRRPHLSYRLWLLFLQQFVGPTTVSTSTAIALLILFSPPYVICLAAILPLSLGICSFRACRSGRGWLEARTLRPPLSIPMGKATIWLYHAAGGDCCCFATDL